MTMVTPARRPIGHMLREWRQRRRKSQLALACEADISTRHLSSSSRLAARSRPRDGAAPGERLDVPLRDRNVLLTAAGFAPSFSARSLDDPSLAAARGAVDWILAAHEPYPALALDAHWNLLASNKAVPPLLAGVDPALLKPPLNVMRLTLHSSGLAPRIANLAEWRAHLLARLQRQIDATADAVLIDLMGELRGYPTPIGAGRAGGEFASVAVPFKLVTERGLLSFMSTTTVFGTPVDITLAELALESFFPADALTAEMLRRAWVGQASSAGGMGPPRRVSRRRGERGLARRCPDLPRRSGPARQQVISSGPSRPPRARRNDAARGEGRPSAWLLEVALEPVEPRRDLRAVRGRQRLRHGLERQHLRLRPVVVGSNRRHPDRQTVARRAEVRRCEPLAGGRAAVDDPFQLRAPRRAALPRRQRR
jgi:hypothetical protein